MATERADVGASEYLHGTTPEEQARLSKLNLILNDASIRELRLCGGEKILDVGSGLAQLTRQMARAAGPAGHVVGIERSPEQIAEARRQAAASGEESIFELRQGDVSRLPMRADEWGTFDVAHARFLLEHVPDPLAVVRAMVRAVRVGGRVVIEDDDHETLRLWPEVEGFSPVWNAYMALYTQIGCDPIVGRRLVELLHAAGATPARNTWIFFGSCSGHPDFAAYVDNLAGVVDGARQRILNLRLIEAAEFDRAMTALVQWKQRPDAAIWFAMAWAEGLRRE